MKVLLVHPPSRRLLPSILPAEVEAGRGCFPALGVLYLAASLRDLEGVEVEVIDAQAERLGPGDIAARVYHGGFDLAGITVLTHTLRDALEAARAVKTVRPETVVIAGGPHPHLYPGETLGLGPFDGVVRGEGEDSLRELAAGWPGTRGAPPPGTWWKDGGKGEPDPAPFIEDLDRLPFPARDLTRMELYHSALSGARPITTMMSSRGCRCLCAFCDRPHLGKRFRARSAKNVADEMEEAAGLGAREIVFYDDTFTSERERALEIAELVRERGLGIPWDIRARVSDLQPGDYRILARAGLARVHFGVESGDPEILKSLRKGITIGQAREAFHAARAAGIETLAYFMAGLPGETPATLDKTLDLARELDPDYVHFSLLVPFPGTPLYDEALERGTIPRDVWAEFARDPSRDFTPPVWEENLQAPQLAAALARMYRAFYSRPRVVLRRLRRVRDLAGLVRGARLGLKIVSLRGR